MVPQRAGMDVEQLISEHHQAVYRYAYRLTGSVPDAEDLTQQVFLIAQQKLGQLRETGSARGWLFTILRNSFLKSRARQRPVTEATLQLDISRVPAKAPRDEDIDREQLQCAIDQLPDHFRLVLLMFYFEECSYREIAERLDLPMGTVMSRLARAKAHLRSRLFEPNPEGNTEKQTAEETSCNKQDPEPRGRITTTHKG